MADLFNLFDEINEGGEEEAQQQEIVTPEGAGESEEWEQPHHRENVVALPPALDETSRRLYTNDAEDDPEGNLDGSMDGTPGHMGAITKIKSSKSIHVEDYSEDEEDDEEDELDYYGQLKRVWTQEVSSPELLPFPEDLIIKLTDQLQERQEEIERIEQQQCDSNCNNDGGSNSSGMTALIASILKVDLDRVQYMICDLLRTRLHKIQKHPLFMREWTDRMSEQEIDFLKGYGQLLEYHLNTTVLDHMPRTAWKKLDEPNMIDKPDLNQYVLIRVMDETVEINTALNNDDDDDESKNNNIQQHPKGTCLIARYNVIQDLFHEGKVELC